MAHTLTAQDTPELVGAMPWEAIRRRILVPGIYQLITQQPAHTYHDWHRDDLDDCIVLYDHMDQEMDLYQGLDLLYHLPKLAYRRRYVSTTWDVLVFKNVAPIHLRWSPPYEIQFYTPPGQQHGAYPGVDPGQLYVGDLPPDNADTVMVSEHVTPEKSDTLTLVLCDQTQQPGDAHSAFQSLLKNVSITVQRDHHPQTILHMHQQSGTLDFDAQKTQTIQITLASKGFAGQDIGVIAVNHQAIALTANTLILTPSHWQHSTPHVDAKGNRHYTLPITLLPPAKLLNFRQDGALSLLGEEAEVYQALQPYFTQDPHSQKHPTSDPALDQDWMRYFQKMGNNITFFIHGYNVEFGQFLPGFKGHGAHGWLLSMEHNLNQAAGFDGKDYLNYTRIVGIAWQGNPTSGLDYMAAPPLSQYPARRLAQLIQQLKQAGLCVNLMAHSLGNAVLMNTLEYLSASKTSVDHVFLWEAAIPNTSFNPVPIQGLPMILQNQTLNYGYSYPHAHQAADKITVLYSDEDTILSSLPPNSSDLTDIKILWDTREDPGAGTAFSTAAAGTAAMGPIARAAGITTPLVSIYHLANLYVYPIHYFINASNDALERYYHTWKNFYQTYQDPTGATRPLAPTLAQQQKALEAHYPLLFGLLAPSGNTNASQDLPQSITLQMIERMQNDFPHPLPDRKGKVLTIFLTGLLTPQASPVAALGAGGIPKSNPFFSHPGLFQTAQQDSKGHDLCFDHSAMRFPTEKFMKDVYQRQLMHQQGLGFTSLGRWPNIGKSLPP